MYQARRSDAGPPSCSIAGPNGPAIARLRAASRRAIGLSGNTHLYRPTIPASQRGHGRASDDQVSPVGAGCTGEQLLLPISASVALSRVAGLAAARWEGEREHLTTEAMRLSPNGLSQRPAEEALAGCTLEEALAAKGSATAADAAHAEPSACDDVSGTLASNHGPPNDTEEERIMMRP